MVITIRKLAKELKINTPDLITRPTGKRVYEKIQQKLAPISSGETVLLDFENIKVIDSSFIDECIVNLILESMNDLKHFFVKLKNISDIAEININSVFDSYARYNNKKIVVITDEIRQNNSFFIGPLDDMDKRIIEFMRINKTAHLHELIKFIGKDGEEGKEIINKLFSLRLIRKIDKETYSTL